MTEEDEQEELEPKRVALGLVGKVLESNRVVIDFDVIALAGLTASVYQIGPDEIVESFMSIMTEAFSKIAQGIGNPLEGAGSALGGFWSWLSE